MLTESTAALRTGRRFVTLALAASGFAVIVGTLLPWAIYESVDTDLLIGLTTDGPLLRRLFDRPVVPTDGWLMLVLGALLVFGALGTAKRVRWARLVSWIAVAAVAALTIFEIATYTSENGVPTYYTEPHDRLGVGLFVVAVGAVIAIAALIFGRGAERELVSSRNEPEPE